MQAAQAETGAAHALAARLQILSIGTVLLHCFVSRTADPDADAPAGPMPGRIAKILDLFFFLGT
jgi:hypothetical protein